MHCHFWRQNVPQMFGPKLFLVHPFLSLMEKCVPTVTNYQQGCGAALRAAIFGAEVCLDQGGDPSYRFQASRDPCFDDEQSNDKASRGGPHS